MVEIDNLRVSLTKNGYLKIARLVAEYPSHELLRHTSGSLRGVNLVSSQVANVLCADPGTGVVPALWDDIRDYDRPTIRAFTFLAVVFSHYRLLETFIRAGRGSPDGTLFRSEFQEKEYTNLIYAMSEVGMCEYHRGADQITYDMRPLTDQLRNLGPLIERLLRAKLRRCGWRDPEEYRHSTDLRFIGECIQQQFNEVLGMSEPQFDNWISGRPNAPR